MVRLQGIRACVFDAYGTLFDVHAPMRRLAPEIGPRAEEISRLWRQKQLEYSWLRSLMGEHADFWHVTGDALDYALEVHGVSEPGLRDEMLALYLKLDAYPEVAEALSGLAKENLRSTGAEAAHILRSFFQTKKSAPRRKAGAQLRKGAAV